VVDLKSTIVAPAPTKVPSEETPIVAVRSVETPLKLEPSP
jgi:hypothetical protein